MDKGFEEVEILLRDKAWSKGKGHLSKEIADLLSISINTVNRHRQNILAKLQVDNAIEACTIVRKMGLID